MLSSSLLYLTVVFLPFCDLVILLAVSIMLGKHSRSSGMCGRITSSLTRWASALPSVSSASRLGVERGHAVRNAHPG
jgi:hypothetical protein